MKQAHLHYDMADKEASIYIVDIGKSMGRQQQGRSQTDLQWAMSYVWDKITSAVATDRKTLLQGVIALKSDVTANESSHDDAYANIEVVQNLQQILLPQLHEIGKMLKPSTTNKGDAVSAVVTAVQMIATTCKHLKYRKNITLVTNGMGSFDTDGMEPIVQKIKDDGIRLTVLGLDFDDSDFGFKEEDKAVSKRQNEAALKMFVEQCGGNYGTMAEAIGELGHPRVKETRPVPSYKGSLTLGDPREYPDTAMVIDVERYPRTAVRRPQTASSFVVKSAADSSDETMGGTNEAQPGGDGLIGLRNEVEYCLAERDAEGNPLTVAGDDLARGYEYGKTAVHISESDEGVTKLETIAGMEILGFIPTESFERYMGMSTSHIIIAQRSNSKSVMALSSFIHALHELESFAVVKLVPKEGKDPTIELLAPEIQSDFEGLIDVQLPFAEDVRSYKFPPLDEVVTVSGKVLKEHRYLPTDKLQAAMDEYVDCMDLSGLGNDEAGEPAEFAAFEDTFSPVLHRIDQAVRHRAVHPEEPIPAPYDILLRYRNQPEVLQQRSERQLEALMAAANVKKIPPKVAGRRKGDTIKPLSGLDVNSLLGDTDQRARVDPENSIPTFKHLLDNPPNENALQEVAEQMGAIIEKRIQDSFGDLAYDQAIAEMTVMRQELIELEEGVLWNQFIRSLKARLLGNKLGEGRDEMWWQIRKARLGLQEGKVPGDRVVTADDARDFLLSKPLAIR